MKHVLLNGVVYTNKNTKSIIALGDAVTIELSCLDRNICIEWTNKFYKRLLVSGTITLCHIHCFI